jgi:hypothetical protein
VLFSLGWYCGIPKRRFVSTGMSKQGSTGHF